MAIAVVIGVLSCALSQNAADLQATVTDTLDGGTSTAVDCQTILAGVMGWRACSPSGIVVHGEGVAIQEYDPVRAQRELQSCAPVLHFFAVTGTGPQPIEILIPAEEGLEYEVYQRIMGGLYARVEVDFVRLPGYVVFETATPGRFVVREADEYADLQPANEYLTRWLMRGPPSMAPEAKGEWGLFPVAPGRVSGPIPVVLIHGAHADRWDAFVHWAIWSPQAEAFRNAFQLWTFNHPTYEVNAAIGYNVDFPLFRESMAACLNRFIVSAAQRGVEVEGETHRFNGKAYCILAHGQGGLVARALMKHYPDHAERILGVVTLATPHMGTPLATPEWVRHTVSRFGIPTLFSQVIEGALAESFYSSQFSKELQSDLDMGWLNHDAQEGFGIAEATFESWRPDIGFVTVQLSARDANRTAAHSAPGYNDVTFEPALPLATYCGGLDEITPRVRGAYGMDKFFLYGAHLDLLEDCTEFLTDGMEFLEQLTTVDLTENGSLYLLSGVLGLTQGGASNSLAGPYAVNDGLAPLQSQLMLDGTEGELVYGMSEEEGTQTMKFPVELREDLIAEHTLGMPDRLRIFRGMSHLDIVFGGYDAGTGESEIFLRVAEDLVSVVPAE